MRFHGRARVNPRNPQAFAICDRCGRRRNHVDLRWQYQWAGLKLINLRVLVCKDKCLDVPAQFLRTPILPQDPVPIKNARPEMAVMTVPINQYVQQTVYGTNLPTPPTGNPKPGLPTLPTSDDGEFPPVQYAPD